MTLVACKPLHNVFDFFNTCGQGFLGLRAVALHFNEFQRALFITSAED